MKPEQEKSEDVFSGLMPLEAFERRFSFIVDDTHRKNIAIVFEYIVFLIDSARQEDHKPLIRSSLYKDATVYTGAVIEACLSYVLHRYVSSDPSFAEKVLVKDWKIEKAGSIHRFNKEKRIRFIIEQLQTETLKKNPDFITINRMCRKGGILTENEFDLAEDIRKARNKIHMSGLADIDNTYSQESLDGIFNKAARIINKIEEKLGDIESV